MTSLESAGFWIALNIFLLIYLSFRVGGARSKHKVNLGDGDNVELTKAIRAQGNYIEYAPAALGGLVMLALLDASALLIHFFGAFFFFARVSHLLGLGMDVWSKGRFVGTLCTMLVLLAIGFALLYFSLN